MNQILGIRFDCSSYLLYFVCKLGTSCVLLPISLERTLQVLVGEDRKSRLSDYFSVLASSSLHMSDLALHMMLFPYCMCFLIKKKKKNTGENMQDIFFSWHISYCMCFHLISQFVMH
jgi:hypothetical protein